MCFYIKGHGLPWGTPVLVAFIACKRWIFYSLVYPKYSKCGLVDLWTFRTAGANKGVSRISVRKTPLLLLTPSTAQNYRLLTPSRSSVIGYFLFFFYGSSGTLFPQLSAKLQRFSVTAKESGKKLERIRRNGEVIESWCRAPPRVYIMYVRMRAAWVHKSTSKQVHI